MSLNIGTSGWSYDHWKNVLYPEDMAKSDRLAHFVSAFDTVELNSSYYHWPKLQTFKNWQQRLPEGFTMSVKAPRSLTHYQRLKSPEKWLEIIFQSWHALFDKRGIFLVQLSPRHSFDYQRLEYFLHGLPWWLRTAVEFRHPSWHREEVFQLLEKYQVAYCIMSGAYLPCILRATAPFVYIRLHGPDHYHMYGGSYGDSDLHWWAQRINEYRQQGKDVFAYFNNDGEGNAVRNAHTLRSILN